MVGEKVGKFQVAVIAGLLLSVISYASAAQMWVDVKPGYKIKRYIESYDPMGETGSEVTYSLSRVDWYQAGSGTTPSGQAYDMMSKTYYADYAGDAEYADYYTTQVDYTNPDYYSYYKQTADGLFLIEEKDASASGPDGVSESLYWETYSDPMPTWLKHDFAVGETKTYSGDRTVKKEIYNNDPNGSTVHVHVDEESWARMITYLETELVTDMHGNQVQVNKFSDVFEYSYEESEMSNPDDPDDPIIHNEIDTSTYWITDDFELIAIEESYTDTEYYKSDPDNIIYEESGSDLDYYETETPEPATICLLVAGGALIIRKRKSRRTVA